MANPRFISDVTHSFTGDSLRGDFRVRVFDSDGDSNSDGVIVTQLGTNRAASFLKGTEEFEILSIPELSQEQVDLIDYAFSVQPNAGYVSLFPNVPEGNPLLTKYGAEQFRNERLVANVWNLEKVTDTVVGSAAMIAGFGGIMAIAAIPEVAAAAGTLGISNLQAVVGSLALGATGLGGFWISSGESDAQTKIQQGQRFRMPELVAEGAEQSGTALADCTYFVGFTVAAGGVSQNIPEIARASMRLRNAYFASKPVEVMPRKPAIAIGAASGPVIDIQPVNEFLPVLACESAPAASFEIPATTDFVPATFSPARRPFPTTDSVPPWATGEWRAARNLMPPVLPAVDAPASLEIGPDGLALQSHGPVSPQRDGRPIALVAAGGKSVGDVPAEGVATGASAVNISACNEGRLELPALKWMAEHMAGIHPQDGGTGASPPAGFTTEMLDRWRTNYVENPNREYALIFGIGGWSIRAGNEVEVRHLPALEASGMHSHPKGTTGLPSRIDVNASYVWPGRGNQYVFGEAPDGTIEISAYQRVLDEIDDTGDMMMGAAIPVNPALYYDQVGIVTFTRWSSGILPKQLLFTERGLLFEWPEIRRGVRGIWLPLRSLYEAMRGQRSQVVAKVVLNREGPDRASREVMLSLEYNRTGIFVGRPFVTVKTPGEVRDLKIRPDKFFDEKFPWEDTVENNSLAARAWRLLRRLNPF